MPENKFIPKSASKYANVKVWGQQKSPVGVSSSKSSKTFAVDKNKIQKIFAPNITISDKNSPVQINTQQENDKDSIEILSKIEIINKFNELKSNNSSKGEATTTSQPIKKTNSRFDIFANSKKTSQSFFNNWWDSIKFDYYEKEWFRKLNYQCKSLNILKNLNVIIVAFCLISFGLFFVYLTFFDQYFTVKKYVVNFTNGSYLNKQQTFQLINNFQKNKLYNIFPNNQYWFANNLSLTTSAKSVFPEINSVKVKSRQWPSQINLEIETDKPIVTLFVTENNEPKYWRINSDGKITSQDNAAIWHNLVKVEKPYTLQNIKNQENLSLYSHSFENNVAQKQRFNLTQDLIEYFDAIDIDINSITYPSISDTDINIETTSGSNFMFDSIMFDENLQIQRLDHFLKSKSDKVDFYSLEKKGEYAYFDFRIQNKIYYCQVQQKCNTPIEEQEPKETN